MHLCKLSVALLLGTAAGTVAAQATIGGWRGNGLQIDARPGTYGFTVSGESFSYERLSVDAGYRVRDNWGIGGQLALTPRGNPMSGVPGAVAHRGDAYHFGLWKADSWLRGDRLSLSVGQMPRSDPFGLGLNAMTSASPVPRDGSPVGLRVAREVSTELLYTTPLSKSAGLGFSLVNRTRFGLDGAVPDERVMSIRFSTRF